MKSIQIIIFLLLLNFISEFYTQGQAPYIDSLQKQVSIVPEDSNKVNLLNQLSKLTQGSSFVQSFRFVN